MAFSIATYVASGSTSDFGVPFDYLDKAHVQVWKNNVLLASGTDYTWTSGSNVHLALAPANGANIVIKRSTPATTMLVDQQPAVYSHIDANTANKQLLFVAQEAQDQSQATLATIASLYFQNNPTYVASINGKGGAINKLAEDDIANLVSDLADLSSSIASLNSLKANVSSLALYAALGAGNVFSTTQGITIDDAATNSATGILNLNHTTTGTSAAGFGIRIRWWLENAAGVLTSNASAALDVIFANAAAAAEATLFNFITYFAGGQGLRFSIGGGLWSANATGGDPGPDKINIKGLQIDGVQVSFDPSPWITLMKANNMSVTSNTTLANDAEGKLQFAVTNGKTYEVEFGLEVESGASYKVGFNGPTTSYLTYTGYRTVFGSSTLTGLNNNAWGTADSASQTYAQITGRLRFTATANGTFAVQFAQNASSATPAVLGLGSFIRYRQVN